LKRKFDVVAGPCIACYLKGAQRVRRNNCPY